VLRAEEAASAVLVSVAPTIAHTTPFSPSFEVALSPLASPGEALLLDADGDGVVDRTLVFPSAPFSQEYVVPGSVRPSLFVRTCDGVLLSAPPRTVPRIQVLPPPVEATADAFGASGMKGVDAARHAASSELFVLSPSQG